MDSKKKTIICSVLITLGLVCAIFYALLEMNVITFSSEKDNNKNKNQEQEVIDDNTQEENNNENQEVVDTPKEETKTVADSYQTFLTNLTRNMKNWIAKGGYFEETTYFSYQDLEVNYRIADGLKLYLSAKSQKDNTINYDSKYIDDNVLTASIYSCGNTGYICLKYLKTDGTVYIVSSINYPSSNFEKQLMDNWKKVIIFAPGNIYGGISIDGLAVGHSLDSITPSTNSNNYQRFLENIRNCWKVIFISPDDDRQYSGIDSMNVYDKIGNKNYYIASNDLKLYYDENTLVDEDEVLLFKVLYDKNNKPTLYYLTDWGWHSLDYYNKSINKNNIGKYGTLFDVTNIIDIRKFVYDNGDDVNLLEFIDGNFSEIMR